jgi:ferredoxin
MCPELFQWDDQGECVVVADESVDREDVERAMAYCPNDCIEIEDG